MNEIVPFVVAAMRTFPCLCSPVISPSLSSVSPVAGFVGVICPAEDSSKLEPSAFECAYVSAVAVTLSSPPAVTSPSVSMNASFLLKTMLMASAPVACEEEVLPFPVVSAVPFSKSALNSSTVPTFSSGIVNIYAPALFFGTV